MGVYTIQDTTLIGIGNAIRTKLQSTNTYTPLEMPQAILSIHGGDIPPVEVPSWSTGTDLEIVNAIAADRVGTIDLHDYWTVGDTRVVNLSPMSAVGVSESHVAQSVELVLMDSDCNGFTWNTQTESGYTKPKFIVGMKGVLADENTLQDKESGYMNSTSTNTGGWGNSARRTWCNSVFKGAIPSTLVGIFKEFNWKVASGSAGTLVDLTDTFALPVEKVITGQGTVSASAEASLYNQWAYYANVSNRIKYCGPDMPTKVATYWTASSINGNNKNFGFINANGTIMGIDATTLTGITVFGCI